MLIPVISKPSRITAETKTQIHHIFTNKIEAKIVGGLIMSDISDHLPVFAVFHNCREYTTEAKSKKYILTRCITSPTLQTLNQDSGIYTGVTSMH